MNSQVQTIRVKLFLGSLSPTFPGPSGKADGLFYPDGTFVILMADGGGELQGERDSKLSWRYGLIDGVDEEYLHLGPLPMTYAKVLTTQVNDALEVWLNKFQPKEEM